MGKHQAVFTVVNDKGLHMRPSTELVRCASRFDAEIFLTYRGKTVEAKSILGILLLAAEKGAKIVVLADGVDAEGAVRAIVELAELGFYMEY